jgi:Spy/CpxP family protein refolding chaperone
LRAAHELEAAFSYTKHQHPPGVFFFHLPNVGGFQNIRRLFMKFLLSFLALSVMTIGIVGQQPAWSKPTSSPTTSSGTSSNSGTSNSPLLRGVTFTTEQRAKIAAIQTKMNNKMVAKLTPAQKETLKKSGASAVQLTPAQKTEFQQIIASANAEIKSVLTPEQIKKIEQNAQSMQQSSGGQRR